MMLSGCSSSNESIATIQANTDSEQVKTFKNLNIGRLFEFNFILNDADKTWVEIWVEQYENGELSEEPLSKLSYGLSPNKVDKGNILFGMMNTDKNIISMFLAAPEIRTSPEIIENLKVPNSMEAWEYAIGEEKQELEYGKTYLLAVYRQKNGDSIRSGYDYQDEEELKNMLNEHTMVCLLKIKLEET